MSNWRQNPNLLACFDNCVAMLHTMPVARPLSRGEIIKQRRLALGLSPIELGRAAGYPCWRSHSPVCAMESGEHWCQRIADTLSRLEAERQQEAAQ